MVRLRLHTMLRTSQWLTLAVLFAACDKTEAPARSWRDVCVDLDGDGYGFQCAAGEDCNDQDPSQFEGCVDCASGNQAGCACPSEGATDTCVDGRAITDAGALACTLGTRTCRSGVWSSCENTSVVEVPAPRLAQFRAVIDGDAAPRQCDPCHPDCYQVNDPLDESDASLGNNVVSSTGGGITLSSQIVASDGGVLSDAGTGGSVTDAACVPGSAPDRDCDGVPDDYDPFPTAPPFASTHQTIFMDLEPGKSASSDFDIRFYLNTADIYLYLDMTGSMDGERTNLLNSFTTGNYLPDGGVGVECADRNQNGSTADEEDLKTGGIIGNLACIVRDSWLGAGWHRDMPFTLLDEAGFSYGPPDFELFHNEVDLTNDVPALQAALNRFATRGGINRPEGGIMGLYLLATGEELYLGWNRQGNPRRTCPAGRYGYPCWREDAVPIVIWVTDAPLTNGPPTAENHLGPASNWLWSPQTVNQPMNWGVANTRIDTGTASAYFPVTGNDTYATAYDVGSVNDSFRTFTGDTTGMSADLTTALAGACVGGNSRSSSLVAWDPSQEGAPDAFFKFRVDEAEPLTISTQGSHLKSSLIIVDAARANTTSRLATATNGNASAAAALDLGTVDFLTTTALVNGTTSSGTALYTRDVFGTCLTQQGGASDKVAANVVKFNLANDLPGGLRMSADGNYGIATALFSAAPQTPTDTNISSLLGNVMDSYSLGNLNGRYVRLTSGTVNTTSVSSDYPASLFTSAEGCESVTADGKDAAFEFTLSTPTRVRIEGAGNNGTLTAGFEHVIALAPRSTVTRAADTNNYSDATAAVIDLSQVPTAATGGSEFTGVLGGVPTTYLQSELGPFASYTSSTACTNAAAASSSASQAVYTFDVTSGTAGDYTFETGGSSVSTWLSLHRTNADSQVNIAQASPAPLNTGVVQDLGQLKQQSFFVQQATLEGHGSLATDYVNRSNFGCASGPLNNGGSDAIYSFTVDATRTVRVTAAGGGSSNSALSAGSPGFNAHVGVFAGTISAATRVAGDCSDPSGNGYTTADFTASPGITYYVVVKQLNTASAALTGSSALYGLWIRDIAFSDSFVSCNYGSQVNYPTSIRASRVSATLTPGRYYAVIKGTAASAYKLSVRRTTTSLPALLACNKDGIATNRSVIERDLPAGRYTVFVRAHDVDDVGSYNLILRDVGFAPVALGCGYDNNVSSAIPSSALVPGTLRARRDDGSAIDYYAVVRGNTSTGANRLYLENGAFKPNQCAFDNLVFSYPPIDPYYGYRFVYDVNNGEWKGTLQPGDYYAIVKGENVSDSQSNTEDDDQGRYQLSIGDQDNHAGVSDMAQKTWLGPNGDGRGGIREALLNREIRVVTVDSTRGPTQTSGTDDPTYSNQQLRAVAQETHALRTDGSPLFFTINNDGTGLGSAIVEGVAEVAGSVAMDVTARLVEAPDSPAPRRFGFVIEAVDTPGDLCAPPIDTDRDAARTPDTHVGCTPGAQPKFRVTFTNPPAPDQVLPNPRDPNGGYTMRVELIGDGQYVVDAVPVYIVPANVVADPGERQYAASGEYAQDTSAAGCSGTESPVWTTLEWQDSLPYRTSIRWDICTADTLAGLDGCTYRTAATVTAGDPCTTSATCPNGYCAASGYCEYVAGPSCTSASDCGLGGVCVAGTCAWTSNPIDLKPVLAGGAQGKKYLRTRVTLNANPSRTEAPTVQTWGVKYTCTPQE